MAPPPEYDKEPKAPDKSVTSNNIEDPKIPHSVVVDQHTNLDNKSAASAVNVEPEDKHVEALDDGQLRALLDEAITYKRPKDREGKSSLFKELLEEVEQDEQACEAAARGWGAGAAGRARGVRAAGGGGGRRGRALPHSNSLQDLVAALAAEPAPRRRAHHQHGHHQPAAQVSARTHHGGSLPSGVDTSFLLGEEPRGAPRGVEYVATVHCENPSPLNERRVSASDAHCPAETDALNRRSKMAAFPMTYTARATLEIGSGAVCSGRAVTTTTPSNQVDSGIPFSCITTPEVVTSCSTTSSSPQAALAVDSKPLQLCSGYRAVASVTGGGADWLQLADSPADGEPPPPPPPPATAHAAAAAADKTRSPASAAACSYNGLPLSRPSNYGATTSSSDDYKKSLDENGNSVQGFSSPLSGSSQHNKKPRRKKSSKNETVIKSHQIDGYQGNKDLNEVLRFIESNEEQTRGKLHHRAAAAAAAKHNDDDKGKKRSTERRHKDKGIKRATSMEELSRTTLADLTDKPELRRGDKQPVAAAAAAAPAAPSERRSWGDDTRDYYHQPASPPAAKHDKKKAKPSKSVDSSAAAPLEQTHADTTVELLDFQTVTKKKKQRKRFEEGAGGGGGGGGEYRKPRPSSPERRRKSAPPSDKSNDSNDDMDSVHSLPADLPPAAAPPAPPAAPHASYADIARTRHNIPDLIESCNFYTDEPPEAPRPPAPPPPPARGDPPAPAIDVDSYPALDARVPRSRNKQQTPRAPPPAKEFTVEKATVVAAEERRELKPRTPPAPLDAPLACPPEETTALPPDVVSDRRPPVILLDEATRPRDMDGITFGFDINEQLLNGEVSCGPRARRCDLLRDALASAETGGGEGGGGVCVRAGGCGLRYVPPAPLAPTTVAHLHRIVDYVGGAWEDIMKCGSGKVRYFTE